MFVSVCVGVFWRFLKMSDQFEQLNTKLTWANGIMTMLSPASSCESSKLILRPQEPRLLTIVCERTSLAGGQHHDTLPHTWIVFQTSSVRHATSWNSFLSQLIIVTFAGGRLFNLHWKSAWSSRVGLLVSSMSWYHVLTTARWSIVYSDQKASKFT